MMAIPSLYLKTLPNNDFDSGAIRIRDFGRLSDIPLALWLRVQSAVAT